MTTRFSWPGILIRIGAAVMGVALFAIPSSSLPGGKGADAAKRMTGVYDMYIGFSAKTECVPEKGPYLTELSHDVHVPRLRFVLAKSTAGGVKVNWHPLHGEGKEPSYPELVFSAQGQIDAKICPHIKCDKEIKRAWFTRQDRQFQVILAVVPTEEIPDVQSELLEGEAQKPLDQAAVPIIPCVLHVKFLARDKFTWSGECIVRGQDCGGTGDLEFYLSLPFYDLLQGKAVALEFPFQNDDIDAQGTLSVRFLPAK